MKVEYSIHRTVGKPRLPGEIRGLGDGWTTATSTMEELWELITVDGHATSSALSDSHRCGDNFAGRQVFMIDIDSGMTVDELLENPTYNELAWGFYVTPSHTGDHHRFRIVFVTESPVTDAEHCMLVFKQLTAMFPQCDSVCRDPTRIFYGTPGCEIKEVLGNIITDETVRWIIERMRPTPTVNHHPPSEREITSMPKRVLDLIKGMRPGDRSARACKIGGIARWMTPELKAVTEQLLVEAGCDRAAIKSFRRYSNATK